MKTLSEAITAGVASWALDYDTLIELRTEGVPYAGVIVKDDDDVYLAPLDFFFDRTKIDTRNYAQRGGALQNYLPLQHFQRLTGTRAVK